MDRSGPNGVVSSPTGAYLRYVADVLDHARHDLAAADLLDSLGDGQVLKVHPLVRITLARLGPEPQDTRKIEMRLYIGNGAPHRSRILLTSYSVPDWRVRSFLGRHSSSVSRPQDSFSRLALAKQCVWGMCSWVYIPSSPCWCLYKQSQQRMREMMLSSKRYHLKTMGFTCWAFTIFYPLFSVG